MKYCSNCGYELKESAKFCENCGAPVEEIPEETGSLVREEPVETYAPVTPLNTPEQESLAKSALIFSIIGLVLAEFGIPGIILSAIAKGKVKKATAAGAIGGKLKADSDHFGRAYGLYKITGNSCLCVSFRNSAQYQDGNIDSLLAKMFSLSG